MYSRFKLTARLGNQFVYQRYFPSITQAVKTACGFIDSSDLYISIFDTLTERIFSNAAVLGLCKEFRDDQILF